jgi:hypothetical protein
MSDNSNKGEGTNTLLDPTDEEQEDEQGRSGKSSHGGDLAPPNQDDAGRVIAPQKGDPKERH